MKKIPAFILSVLTVTCASAAGTLPGDANGNGRVTIADVVTLVNYILDIPYAAWDAANADVNNDKAVTVSDIASTVDVILKNTEYSGEGLEITRISDRLIAGNFPQGAGETGIDVRLDDSKEYASLQAEISVPEGMTVTGITAGPRTADHRLLYNITDEGTVRLVMVSFNNIPFKTGDQPLFTIKGVVDGDCGDLKIGHIIAANADGNNYELGFSGGLAQGDSSGADLNADTLVTVVAVPEGVEVRNATGSRINVFTMGGELYKSVTAVSDYEKIRLSGGIYIVTVGNLSVKVVI